MQSQEHHAGNLVQTLAKWTAWSFIFGIQRKPNSIRYKDLSRADKVIISRLRLQRRQSITWFSDVQHWQASGNSAQKWNGQTSSITRMTSGHQSVQWSKKEVEGFMPGPCSRLHEKYKIQDTRLRKILQFLWYVYFNQHTDCLLHLRTARVI